ncbi:hypothetical protein JXA02_00715 [candidate division KSB1 bacterium]|nr:hypothetical protein [candidate division KSB1 bacterium]RQW11395.1 MAG: hypothetical protein EH222_00750 [candidate division KSB1 bacterium]
MLSIKNIWTIMRYEVKTLLRSWFFRIFAGLVVIILTFFNIVFFAQAFETMPWEMRGIPSSMPYFNMMLLNVAQAVIALFLASDFIKRDRKLDTTEVIYMRSMSNGDYILGKAGGLFVVFLGLNVLMLVISVIIQVIFTDVVFQPFVYLCYLLLMSIPTLIFIFGLSFFIMSLVKNQAVTFLLLLGYFAVSLIVLNVKFESTFDAVAFFLPFSHSDFVGFSQLTALLMHRMAYLSLGLGFIFLTILLFKRLPQSRAMQTTSAVLAVIFLLVGSSLFISYLARVRSGDKLRAAMIALNDRHMQQPIADILSYDLEFEHTGQTMSMDAELILQNNTAASMTPLILTLNPALDVQEIKLDGQDVPFTRELHVIQVDADLSAGARASLSMRYSGSIDNRAFYLVTPKEEREKMHDLMLYKRGKDFSYLEPEFVLLTAEANWYPIAGVSMGSALVTRRQKNFADYHLKVKTERGLVAISQGQARPIDDGYEFKTETPLPQISLVIGDYVQRSIDVDSVAYHLYTHRTHDYFLTSLSAVSDTLAPLIRELKNDYELKTNVDYPFKSFSLIEVPIHFKTFAQPLRFHQDWVQPGQVFLPENGAALDGLDFKSQIDRSMDRMQDRNETISEMEMQYMVLRRFIEGDLFGTRPNRFFGGQQETGLHAIFPNFYHFRNAIASPDLPILDATLEAFLKGKVETTAFSPARFSDAITDDEKANIVLRDYSLQEILADPENVDKASIALKMKSSYLFRYLESKVGIEKLETFLAELLDRHQFKILSSSELIATMNEELGIDLQGELQAWYQQKNVPGFYFTNMKNYKIVQDERTKYQVLLNVYNPEPVGGVVVFDFFVPGGGMGPGGGFGRFNVGSTDYQRSIYVAPGQAKQIGFVLEDQPRALTINTLVSRNLPSQEMRRLEDFAEDKNAKPFDGVTLLDEPPKLDVEGEIIVDNEDEGFKIQSTGQRSALKRLFNIQGGEDEEYTTFSPWRAPDNWKKTINSIFYGDFVHSAHFVRAGNGDKKVVWEAEIERAGQYEVYAYGENMPFRGRGGPGGPGGPGQQQGGRRDASFIKSFHYTVHHDDGAEQVEWDSQSAQGWNYLGIFYFSAGIATVELSNKSDGRMVIADAVKWVKK